MKTQEVGLIRTQQDWEQTIHSNIVIL